MGQITLDQSHQVLATLAVNTDWAKIDFVNSGLQDLIVRNPKEAGRQFTSFLRNGGRVIIGEPKVISINRGRFNPAEFIGEGWSIVADETDQCSVALAEMDLTKVQQVTMLNDNETCVNGEEKLKRLKKSGNIRLDADVFYTLWTNQHLIPESWKDKVGGNTRYIFFDGTVIRDSVGRRYVLYLYRPASRWDWSARWLGNVWYSPHHSAVLAS